MKQSKIQQMNKKYIIIMKRCFLSLFVFAAAVPFSACSNQAFAQKHAVGILEMDSFVTRLLDPNPNRVFMVFFSHTFVLLTCNSAPSLASVVGCRLHPGSHEASIPRQVSKEPS
jgi:hypothetical protein